MAEIVIGVDGGTTAVKAVAFNLSGDVVSARRESVSVTYGDHGEAEQDMNQIWEAVATCIRSVADVLDPADDVVAIGLTGQGMGHGSWTRRELPFALQPSGWMAVPVSVPSSGMMTAGQFGYSRLREPKSSGVCSPFSSRSYWKRIHRIPVVPPPTSIARTGSGSSSLGSALPITRRRLGHTWTRPRQKGFLPPGQGFRADGTARSPPRDTSLRGDRWLSHRGGFPKGGTPSRDSCRYRNARHRGDGGGTGGRLMMETAG